ncbi:hypothetical protein FHG87_021838 [Trinorchestia longiramus]|nr:hypothetical protein FHG87_021838 [Trinorchestia longiramus]
MTNFAAMIEAQGKNELFATFRNFAQLIESPWIEEDIETLIDHYKNSEIPALDLNFVEPTHALVVEDISRYRDKCAVGKKFEAVAEELPNPSVSPANPSVSPATPSVSPATPSVSPATPSVSPATPSVSPATPSVSPPTAAHFNLSPPHRSKAIPPRKFQRATA